MARTGAGPNNMDPVMNLARVARVSIPQVIALRSFPNSGILTLNIFSSSTRTLVGAPLKGRAR